MKKTFLIALMFGAGVGISSPPAPCLYIKRDAPIQPYESLWRAVCAIESNFNPLAVGDTHLPEHSYGIAQIRRERLDDFNRRTGKHYTTDDMFSPAKSKEVFLHYCTGLDYEEIARTWNGGPDGMNKSATIQYYELIKTKL